MSKLSSKFNRSCLVFVAFGFLGRELCATASSSTNTPIVVPPLPTDRRQRFPSVEERIKIYMGNWYVPSCREHEQVTYKVNNDDGNWSSMVITDQANSSFPLKVLNVIEPDELFWFTNEIVMDCARSEEEYQNHKLKGVQLKTQDRIKFRSNMRLYCEDAREIISVIQHVFVKEKDPTFPVLMQFGDMKHSHVLRMINIPHIKKFRSGTSRKSLAQVTTNDCFTPISRPVLRTNHNQTEYSPIIWKLNTRRHFGLLPLVADKDTPWEEKKDMAIFRGQLTGSLESYDLHKTDYENCRRMKRCRLVLDSANSSLVDAKLVSTRNRIGDEINGTKVVTPRVLIQDLLVYKGIVMIEGNDVASGLKWAMLSQSVVLMPPPKHTSWAMEERLIPWVHYVPLRHDLTDVEKKMAWVVEHSKTAQAISKHATAWMEDMEFHPDARREERIIKAEIIRRYQTHFRRIAD